MKNKKLVSLLAGSLIFAGLLNATPYVGFSGLYMMSDTDSLDDGWGISIKAGYHFSTANPSPHGASVEFEYINANLDGNFNDFKLNNSATKAAFNNYDEYPRPLLYIPGKTVAVEDADLNLFMLNTKYHYAFSPRIGSYLGAGIGLAQADVDYNEYFWNDLTAEVNTIHRNTKSTSLAAQALSGLEFVMNENNIFNMGYRYLYVDDDINPDSEVSRTSIQTHAIEFGYTYQF